MEYLCDVTTSIDNDENQSLGTKNRLMEWIYLKSAYIFDENLYVAYYNSITIRIVRQHNCDK